MITRDFWIQDKQITYIDDNGDRQHKPLDYIDAVGCSNKPSQTYKFIKQFVLWSILLCLFPPTAIFLMVALPILVPLWIWLIIYLYKNKSIVRVYFIFRWEENKFEYEEFLIVLETKNSEVYHDEIALIYHALEKEGYKDIKFLQYCNSY